jgi:hypothetical protein
MCEDEQIGLVDHRLFHCLLDLLTNSTIMITAKVYSFDTSGFFLLPPHPHLLIFLIFLSSYFASNEKLDSRG